MDEKTYQKMLDEVKKASEYYRAQQDEEEEKTKALIREAQDNTSVAANNLENKICSQLTGLAEEYYPVANELFSKLADEYSQGDISSFRFLKKLLNRLREASKNET